MLRDSTFNVPSLIVNIFWKLLFHKSAIRTFRPFTATALVESYHALVYAKFFMAEPVIMFAVITGIGKHLCEADVLTCLPQSGNKFG